MLIFRSLSLMQLLDTLYTFIQRSVNGSRYSERATDNSANTNEETGKALASSFTVDDFHG